MGKKNDLPFHSQEEIESVKKEIKKTKDDIKQHKDGISELFLLKAGMENVGDSFIELENQWKNLLISILPERLQ